MAADEIRPPGARRGLRVLGTLAAVGVALPLLGLAVEAGRGEHAKADLAIVCPLTVAPDVPDDGLGLPRPARASEPDRRTRLEDRLFMLALFRRQGVPTAIATRELDALDHVTADVR